MADYVCENPQFIVNGFIKSGITGALDGTHTSDSEDRQETDSKQDTDDESEEESEDSEET